MKIEIFDSQLDTVFCLYIPNGRIRFISSNDETTKIYLNYDAIRELLPRRKNLVDYPIEFTVQGIVIYHKHTDAYKKATIKVGL